jgi:hypothetical protein
MAIVKLQPLKSLISLLMAATLLISCSNKRASGTHNTIVGMYKLLSIEKLDSTTNSFYEDDFGKGGDSYILYDAAGHMTVHITSKDYRDFKWLPEKQATDKKALAQHIDSMPLEQLKLALTEFSSSFAYTANYSVDEASQIVTHSRLTCSIPSAWGTQVKRHFSFSGDTLILAFPDGTKRLKWLRQP